MSSLRDYWSFCLIIQTPYAASAEIFRDRFLTVLIVLHLNNTVAKAAREQPPHCDPYSLLGQLLTQIM